MDTDDAWITERTGIKERRLIKKDSGEGTASMGVKAAEMALERAGVSKDDIDLVIFATSSNDVINYPDDDPVLMKETAEKYGFSFPYLYDESQDVAKEYDAACTPDFYLFDGGKTLVYRGQMDSSRPKNDLPVTGKDLRAALDSLLTGKTIDTLQKPSLGCNIKWKV